MAIDFYLAAEIIVARILPYITSILCFTSYPASAKDLEKSVGFDTITVKVEVGDAWAKLLQILL